MVVRCVTGFSQSSAYLHHRHSSLHPDFQTASLIHHKVFQTASLIHHKVFQRSLRSTEKQDSRKLGNLLLGTSLISPVLSLFPPRELIPPPSQTASLTLIFSVIKELSLSTLQLPWSSRVIIPHTRAQTVIVGSSVSKCPDWQFVSCFF